MNNFYPKTRSRKSQCNIQSQLVLCSSLWNSLWFTSGWEKQGCLGCRFLGLTWRALHLGTLWWCCTVPSDQGTRASSSEEERQDVPRPLPRHKADPDSSPTLLCSWAIPFNEWPFILKLLQSAWRWLGANIFFSTTGRCYFVNITLFIPF